MHGGGTSVFDGRDSWGPSCTINEIQVTIASTRAIKGATRPRNSSITGVSNSETSFLTRTDKALAADGFRAGVSNILVLNESIAFTQSLLRCQTEVILSDRVERALDISSESLDKSTKREISTSWAHGEFSLVETVVINGDTILCLKEAAVDHTRKHLHGFNPILSGVFHAFVLLLFLQ